MRLILDVPDESIIGLTITCPDPKHKSDYIMSQNIVDTKRYDIVTYDGMSWYQDQFDWKDVYRDGLG